MSKSIVVTQQAIFSQICFLIRTFVIRAVGIVDAFETLVLTCVSASVV